MKQQVTIVMPAYEGWHLVQRNIESLISIDLSYIKEIIVVDDCSPTPNPYTYSPIVRMIRNDENLGYAGTVNNGLKQAQSEYIILLDSDAFLVQPICNRVIEDFNNNKRLGCIGFLSISEKGSPTGSYRLEPTLLGYLMGQTGDAYLERMLKCNKNIYRLPYSCCVAFRRMCLEDVKYFDAENFPVLEADNDLGLRINQSLDWDLIVDESLVVCHQGGKSYKINSKRVRMYHEYRWNLLVKHNKIGIKSLTKFLLRMRIYMEIAIMKIFKSTKRDKQQYADKIDGRRLLLTDIKTYK